MLRAEPGLRRRSKSTPVLNSRTQGQLEQGAHHFGTSSCMSTTRSLYQMSTVVGHGCAPSAAARLKCAMATFYACTVGNSGSSARRPGGYVARSRVGPCQDINWVALCCLLQGRLWNQQFMTQNHMLTWRASCM